MASVELVPVLYIDQLWPKLRDGFDHALMRTGGDAGASDLWVQARNGSAFVFVAHDAGQILAASIWRFEHWRTGRKFRCLAVFGRNRKAWYADMRAVVENAAGGATLVTEGRRGWARVEPDARELRTMYEVRSG